MAEAIYLVQPFLVSCRDAATRFFCEQGLTGPVLADKRPQLIRGILLCALWFIIVGEGVNDLASAATDRFVRKFLPSVAKISYNPVLKFLADAADILPNLLVSDFRALPPNHLRIRIGVGNKVFGNQPWYYLGARDFWFYALSQSWVTTDSKIVDIGCGCGKFAHHWRDYEFNGSRFSGKYIGIDIDPELLGWCRRHFDAERFEFYLSSHASKVYHEAGEGRQYTIPIDANTVDFVFSSSLFTHLLEPELINYMTESHRVLQAGGIMAMNCFLMDYPPPTFGGRHTFGFKIGNAFVESMKLPEAAVAFESRFLFSLAEQVGFQSSRLVTGPNTGKPLLVCHK